ncbi:MAG: LysR family transcriptional regulator [Betaproteobacteria bacterium]|nr:LysR family transcriptional regulator [Betaproteobacteria bacterium]
MLDLIRVFAQVVDSGSFSKAGAVLGMAPSSVARSMDSLEEVLHSTLFKRSTRRLLLTDAGQLFLERALPLLAESDDLLSAMRGLQAEPQGMLRVSVFESFGAQVVCPLLPEFLARYPGARIEIDLENRVIDLNSENVDLAIRVGRPTDSSLKFRRLLTNRMLLCATPEYFARYGRPSEPEDVVRHNCLLLSSERQQHYWYFQQAKDLRRVPVRGNLTARGGTPLLLAAQRGAGLLLLSDWMVDRMLRQGGLETCLPDWEVSRYPEARDEIFVVYRGGRYPNSLSRVFVDFLVERTGRISG